MTEDEAKQRWCPFIRLTADGNGEWHINRDPSIPSSPGDTQAYRCIGSACMAWRETRVTEFFHKVDRTRIRPGELYMRGNAEERERVVGGYCGLVGASQ